MLFPEGLWLVLSFCISVVLSIWSLGFLLFFICLIAFEIGYFTVCSSYNCLGRFSFILASLYGFMIGRSILCEDHNHLTPLYDKPRSMWQDCKNLCGLR